MGQAATDGAGVVRKSIGQPGRDGRPEGRTRRNGGQSGSTQSELATIDGAERRQAQWDGPPAAGGGGLAATGGGSVETCPGGSVETCLAAGPTRKRQPKRYVVARDGVWCDRGRPPRRRVSNKGCGSERGGMWWEKRGGRTAGMDAEMGSLRLTAPTETWRQSRKALISVLFTHKKWVWLKD